jgi:hypothetical protein
MTVERQVSHSIRVAVANRYLTPATNNSLRFIGFEYQSDTLTTVDHAIEQEIEAGTSFDINS